MKTHVTRGDHSHSQSSGRCSFSRRSRPIIVTLADQRRRASRRRLDALVRPALGTLCPSDSPVRGPLLGRGMLIQQRPRGGRRREREARRSRSLGIGTALVLSRVGLCPHILRAQFPCEASGADRAQCSTRSRSRQRNPARARATAVVPSYRRRRDRSVSTCWTLNSHGRSTTK